ncbi:MAG: SDR family NAD(P)-dependent oxidoreductase [Deltaproteobacteria bacterium]|nr:SDR family NAD(P)-dependent oxidoreductase [Deltaproteobacteria bacterium]
MRPPLRSRFEGKTVIITGGASGIGAQTARDFAAEGASVVLFDAQEEAGERVAEEIRSSGGRAVSFRVDVTSVAEVEQGVSRAFEAFGDVQLLVQSAGMLRDALLKDVTEGQWNAVMDVNAKGTLFTGQAVVRRWLAAAGAAPKRTPAEYPDRRIVNVSSPAADGQAGQTCYAASKAAVVAMTKCWSKELGRYNIRSHVVVPGLTETPMVSELLEKDGARWKRAFEEVMPFGFGKPAYVSDAIRFLCSDDFYFANGEVLRVTGGKLTGP